MNKELVLGTALWGWSIDRTEVFRLLDRFYAAGFRTIDTATNYPINKDPGCFRAAEDLLADWIRSRNPDRLKVIVKIGSLSNDGRAENDLSPEFIRRSNEYYRIKFDGHLDSLWFHWDNRDDAASIKASLAANLACSGGEPGVSGIKHPSLYAEAASELGCRVRIQIKHNLFCSDLSRYEPLLGSSKLYFYGINGGGLNASGKYSSSSSVRLRGIAPELYETKAEVFREMLTASGGGFAMKDLNELALLYSYCDPRASGIIVGPSNLMQLENILDFCNRLKDSGTAAETYKQLVARVQYLQKDY